jgi:hypothetical protein
MLSSHLRPGLPSGLLPLGFPTKMLYYNKCFHFDVEIYTINLQNKYLW